MMYVPDLSGLTIVETERLIQKTLQVDENDQAIHGMKANVTIPQAQVDVIKCEVGVIEIEKPN